MGSTDIVAAEVEKAEPSAAERRDRRARRRAKIAAQMHVRGLNSAESFEEVCRTVDVSRDGILFTGRSKFFEKGQLLEVTFPYSDAPGATKSAQTAEVVRVVAQPHGKFAVAVHFLTAREGASPAGRQTERRATPTRYEEGAVLNESNLEQKSPLVFAFEPDATVADSMRKTLEQQGYTFVAVRSGMDAFEFLKSNVPDVLVAEIETGDVSGYDLSANIRSDERLARVPIVLLTRTAQPAHYAASQKVGAVIVRVTKPFQPERLRQVIRLIAPPPESRGFYGDGELGEDLGDRYAAIRPGYYSS